MTVRIEQRPAASQWEIALADYLAKKQAVDNLSPGSEGEDRIVEIMYQAMDLLVEETPAPDAAALIYKMELAKPRWDGFSFPDRWMDTFIADLRRLFGGDQHLQWMPRRDYLLRRYNDGDGPDDGPVIQEARALESRIMETPATGPLGILAKALLVIGMAATRDEEHDARAVFNEAQTLGLMEVEA